MYLVSLLGNTLLASTLPLFSLDGLSFTHFTSALSIYLLPLLTTLCHMMMCSSPAPPQDEKKRSGHLHHPVALNVQRLLSNPSASCSFPHRIGRSLHLPLPLTAFLRCTTYWSTDFEVPCKKRYENEWNARRARHVVFAVMSIFFFIIY
ncbi:hypothetical protein BD769DRAFT_1436057 [Suillus cothurnatus]|nr:hypothetical protein BD769DRAFT_1436057 [Suillus cothurnatus]